MDKAVTGGNNGCYEGCGVLNEGRSVLNEGRSVLNEGRSVLNEGCNVPNEGRSVFNEGHGEVNDGRGHPSEGYNMPNDGCSEVGVGRGEADVGCGEASVGLPEVSVGCGEADVGFTEAGVGFREANVGCGEANDRCGEVNVGCGEAGVGYGEADVGYGEADVGFTEAGVGFREAGVGFQMPGDWRRLPRRWVNSGFFRVSFTLIRVFPSCGRVMDGQINKQMPLERQKDKMMSDQHTAAAAPDGNGPDEKTLLDIMNILDEVEKQLKLFIAAENVDSGMSTGERRRLIGAGVRNWGFIEKAMDIARENLKFLPPNFSYMGMSGAVREMEELRQLVLTLNQFQTAANEAMLVRSDTCYRMALRVYGSLREQARNRVPGAAELFQALLNFFRRRRRPGEPEGETTEKQLERDFHSLIHGHADGRIEVVNERPRASGGVHVVADDTHKGHASLKETGEFDQKE